MAGREFAGGGGVDLTKKMGSYNNGRPLDSAFASAPSNYFLGAGAMVSFGGVDGGNGLRNSIYHPFFDPQETGDEYLEDYVTQPEKKRRLSVDQVQFLEKSFEVENKLEPDRKLQLANELSLQPRQIAVWFQNRRARCKTKSLETEYETLHSSYKSLRTDYDSLLKENEKLKAEVLHLKHEEKDEPAESALMLKEDDAGMISTIDERRAPVSTSKNEEQSESSNDFDPLLESVLWIHGEDIFPKIEDAHCYPNATICGYGFGVEVEDHALSNFWSY